MASITAWAKKVWKDRKTEYPTRRTLTKTDGSQEIVTVARNEGSVSQEGDAFSAENMNDLEERIDAGFTEVNGKLPQLKVLTIPLGVKTTLNPGNFSLLFPTKKEGYTPIAIKSWTLFNRDRADNIHINGVITGQNVSIEGKISGSNQIIIPSNAFVEVLYLVN